MGVFDQIVGEVVQAGGTVLDESFDAAGIPAGWTIVDGSSDSNTWYADDVSDPGGCANTDPSAPIGGTWAAVDSDCTGSGVAMDEELMTPVLDLSGATTVTLEFDHWFRQYQGEFCDVDVRSSLTVGQWVNVVQWTGTSTLNSQHETIDLTAQAAGASDVEIRWHYYNADFEWTWFIDNVEVTFSAPAGCNMLPCAAAGAAPPPVPASTMNLSMNQQMQIDLAFKGPVFNGSEIKSCRMKESGKFYFNLFCGNNERAVILGRIDN